mmetsp:Transcript_1286/g.2354  ORF Transcript_1286/g.2354 Transcript_1286/m.2354 type:complete len:348 (-) Transcript_1286:72-1115(-)
MVIFSLRIPWFSLGLACLIGQITCWLCLAIFFASGRSNKDECQALFCDDSDSEQECSCREGIPFFSYTGVQYPEYFIFGTGLGITMLVGLFGVESINQMYFDFCRSNNVWPETNMLRCCCLCCCCCCDNQRDRACTCRPHIPYMLRSLRPLSICALLCLPILSWVSLKIHFGIHILAASGFFTCLCGYHVMLTLLQRELLIQFPHSCDRVLKLSHRSWRYRIKIAWILVLIALGFLNEGTRRVPRIWEPIVGPLCQWIAILGMVFVSKIHCLDVKHWYRHIDANAQRAENIDFCSAGTLSDRSQRMLGTPKTDGSLLASPHGSSPMSAPQTLQLAPSSDADERLPAL